MWMELADQHNPQWEEQLGNQGNQQAGSQDNPWVAELVWAGNQQEVQVQAGSLGIHKEVAVAGIPEGRQGFVVEDSRPQGGRDWVGRAVEGREEEQMAHWLH